MRIQVNRAATARGGKKKLALNSINQGGSMKRKSNLIIILPTDDSFNSFQLIARDKKKKKKITHI